MKSFHIQFLNRAYTTNAICAKYSDVSDLCPICEKETNSYVHAYWNCEKVKFIWEQIVDIMEALADPEEHEFTMKNCLLSNFKAILFVRITAFFKRFIF